MAENRQYDHEYKVQAVEKQNGIIVLRYDKISSKADKFISSLSKKY